MSASLAETLAEITARRDAHVARLQSAELADKQAHKRVIKRIRVKIGKCNKQIAALGGATPDTAGDADGNGAGALAAGSKRKRDGGGGDPGASAGATAGPAGPAGAPPAKKKPRTKQQNKKRLLHLNRHLGQLAPPVAQ